MIDSSWASTCQSLFKRTKTLTFDDVPEENEEKNKKNTKSGSKHLSNFWYLIFNSLELLFWRDRRPRRRCSRNCRRTLSKSRRKVGIARPASGQPVSCGSCQHWMLPLSPWSEWSAADVNSCVTRLKTLREKRKDRFTYQSLKRVVN